MNQVDFKNLQKGDRVRYVQSGRPEYGNIASGELLVRSPSWLDDDKTVKFENKTHTLFLRADEVEIA